MSSRASVRSRRRGVPGARVLGPLLGVHTANGTLASAGTLPGDASQAPSALFFA